jgi:hypothetical protein
MEYDNHHESTRKGRKKESEKELKTKQKERN